MIQWLNILGGLVAPVTDLYKNYQARKKVKLDSELRINEAVTNAKIKKVETGQLADIRWENTALKNAGIKDEVMMFVILAPMVLCFIPGGAEIVREGFAAMKESIPDYWEYAFYCTVAVSYGIKKLTDLKSIMKGD